MRPKNVTFADVLEHLDDMQCRGLALESLRTRRANVHAWFEWMIDVEVVSTNPASRIKLRRYSAPGKPFITQSEFYQLVDQCHQHILTGSRRAAVLWILLTTGMRRNELTLLEMKDLLWDKEQIWIRHGKGGTSRIVPFLPQAQEAVRLYLQLRREYPEPLLWVTEKGTPFRYHSLGRDIGRVYGDAKVEKKDAFHALRRTFARNAALQGIPNQYIQSVLGWADGQMLQRYTKAMQEEQEQATEAFSNFQPFVDEEETDLN